MSDLSDDDRRRVRQFRADMFSDHDVLEHLDRLDALESRASRMSVTVFLTDMSGQRTLLSMVLRPGERYQGAIPHPPVEIGGYGVEVSEVDP